MTSKKKSTADISAVGSFDDTAVVDIHHPATDETLYDDDGQPMWLEVYGQDSSHYKAIDRNIKDRNLTKAQRARGGQVNITAAQVEAQDFERIVKCVKNWHIVLNGETPECTEANVRDVFTSYPWLRDQAEFAIHDRKNFLRNSSTR